MPSTQERLALKLYSMALEVSFGAVEGRFSICSCIQTCLILRFRQVCFVLLVQQWTSWDTIQFFLHSQFMILDLVIQTWVYFPLRIPFRGGAYSQNAQEWNMDVEKTQPMYSWSCVAQNAFYPVKKIYLRLILVKTKIFIFGFLQCLQCTWSCGL